jgi:peptidoglycan hydrolase-like protein with peptidoglycan-binding domain
MANYNQVGYGAQGSEVTELQKLLNKSGYNLAEDGIFGDKTQAAVRDYQTKYGLDVDGIVGNRTWKSLTLTGSKPVQNAEIMGTAPGATKPTTGNQPSSGGFQYADYQESDTVKQAEAMLNQQLSQKPGEYQSAWQAQLNDTLNKILNREKFSYDLNGDALYQQYKDKYIQQGKMARMDTMGQAQAMTGGYGNSYAQSVGQQAYQSHLQELNDIVPELYQMAYDQYNQEGQDMYNQAALMGQMEDRDYGRHQDAMNAWQAERDYLTGRYDSERDYDYGKYTDERNFGYGSFIDDRNYQYQQDRDAISDQQWQTEFDEAKRQYDEQMALAKEQAAAGGNGGGGGNGDGDAGNDFVQAIFSRVDDNGNYVYYFDGKERTYAPGVNPYTGSKNSDIQYGTFSNGYQPNNIKGQKLSKSGITDVVNGVTQNVWKTPDGKLWIWDGTKNRYLEYDDGSTPDTKPSTSKYGGSGGAGGGKKTVAMFN